MRVDMMNDAAEMLEASGIKDVKTYDNGSAPGMAIHEMELPAWDMTLKLQC